LPERTKPEPSTSQQSKPATFTRELRVRLN
jgi:hypothetical protein